MIFVNLLLIQLILPLVILAWLWGTEKSSRADWLLQVFTTIAVVVFSLIVGSQAWTSVYLGGLLFIFFVAALLKSIYNLPENWGPFKFGDDWKSRIFTASYLLICLIFLSLSIYAFTGYSYSSESLALKFPLKDGIYIVGHGGSNSLINYHNINDKQQYALDISKLNIYGIRAKEIYPEQLKSYAIYGDTLYSPCSGTVQKTVSQLPDHSPPERDQKHPAGNHIIILCKEARIYLAHFMQGSVVVDSGSVINQGVPIGRVGNSGNTSEPHLHIHATRNGNGIPITFNERFLVRNSLIWR